MTAQDRKNENVIEIDHGSGGRKSSELIDEIKKSFRLKSAWKYTGDDGAVFDFRGEKIVFTTDSFIVDPIFFPGGDIGKISMCGTINDLAMMGAQPLGISLSLVIEEGFPRRQLERIIQSINKISQEAKVPIVTGDTKVTDRGKLDKIEITTAGIGVTKHILASSGAKPGDLVISSGSLGEHGAALLAKRFNYATKIKSDCKPLNMEIKSVARFLTSAKDPTRGGISAVLNEVSEKSRVKIILKEERLPFKKEVSAIANLLGIDKFALPSEGTFVATVSKKNADKAIQKLKKFNRQAKIIGSVEKGKNLYLKTIIGGLRKINLPEGKLIPRIC